MAAIDSYAVILFEQAKRFLEKAKQLDAADEGHQAFLTSGILIGVAALEAHLNAVADELLVQPKLTVLDQSILRERDFGLKSGIFELTDRLKMYRIEDRLQFLFARFTKLSNPVSEPWWQGVAQALDTRNKIVHAKDALILSEPAVRRALQAILDCVNALYRGIYRRALPAYARGLNSKLSF